MSFSSKFILSRLPVLADYPAAVQIFDYIDMSLSEVNKRTAVYENWQLILASALVTYLLVSFWHFYTELDHGLVGYLKSGLFKLAKKFPFLSRQIMKELDKTRKGLEEDIMKANKGNLYIKQIPSKGLEEKALFETIGKYLDMSGNEWKTGALSGCVYGADDRLTKLTTKVYEKFAWSNPMHADVFPDVRKMEAEVVRWTCSLFNGDENACGTMTTGGTESIMLACKAYRDMAIANGIARPEMVVPITAHAAFDKAAHFFKIKINHVPVDKRTGKVDPNRLKSYINSNTCMVSFKCFISLASLNLHG
jgi:sphinganine-1-phosphate aldolase